MIVDTSIIVAILKNEPEFDSYNVILVDQSDLAISAANYLEAAIVTDRSSELARSDKLERLIEDAGIRIAAVTENQARIARDAYRRFGKGSGHSAKLNFGDCFSYALAKELGQPLLFKGEDFAQTDIEPALKRG